MSSQLTEITDIFVLFKKPNVKKNRVQIQKHTKIKNAATVTIAKEDHTLGNMISMLKKDCFSHTKLLISFSKKKRRLLKDRDVLFSGYKIRHPLEHNLEIKIQTNSTTNPVKALKDTINSLINDFKLIEEQYKVKPLHFFFCHPLFFSQISFHSSKQQERQKKLIGEDDPYTYN